MRRTAIRRSRDYSFVVQISEHVERLVNLLKRDEGPDTAKDGEDLINAAKVEESDDEDSKIEEI